MGEASRTRGERRWGGSERDNWGGGVGAITVVPTVESIISVYRTLTHNYMAVK